jgi:thiol-disulfide isomerase/thioredoxin
MKSDFIVRLAAASVGVAAITGCVPAAQPQAAFPAIPAGARTLSLSLFDVDCAECADKVVRELRKEGTLYQTAFDKKRVVLRVVADPAVTDEKMLAAVVRAGFRAQIGEGGGAYVPEAKAPEGADVATPVADGHDVPDLARLLVPGKVTLVDFYAGWCGPCRDVDRHVKEMIGRRTDLAYRRLDVVDWDSPLAAHYVRTVPSLPYVIVFAPDGRKVDAIAGLDLARLDAAIAKAKP